jgi:hypothetical protein
MFTGKGAFRVALIAAVATLVAATVLPMVFSVVLAGGFAPQSGEASLATVSPVTAVLLALIIGLAGGVALATEPRPHSRWVGRVGVMLIAAALLATAYMFSPIAAFGFHPAGLAAVAGGGTLLLVAAWLGRREVANRA